ncbi:MAG TPA: endonuclease/exonuclease/phosphatase family protein [Myxococcota bacterium]|nr:endonuclease/exonuclease/phosphatase family protein [Myxococcota bacterium]
MWCSVNGLKAVVPILVFVTACGVSDDNADTPPDSDSGPEILEDAEHVRMMTFNLRTPFADEGDRLWENRKEAVVAQIEDYSPDIMVVQEALLVPQLEDLKKSIPRLDWVGMDNSGTVYFDEYTAIFFDHSKFVVLDWKTFALSETPDVLPSQISDEQKFPRAATWGRFQRIADGFEFDIISTHWDHAEVDGIREEMARITLQQMDILTEGRPALIGADFNCPYDSVPYNIMVGKAEWNGVSGDLTDVWVELGLEEEGTYHSWDGVAKQTSRIDWLLRNDGFVGVSADVLTSTYLGLMTSDHFPVVAEFAIPTP